MNNLSALIKTYVEKNRYLLVPVTLFVFLLAAALLRSPNLFTVAGLAGAILVAAPLILLTIGLTPIVLVGRGTVDLSAGPLMAFVNVSLVAWLTQWGWTSPWQVLTWIIVVPALYQLLQALIIIYVRISPIIVALAGFLIMSGVNLIIMHRAGGVAPDWMSSWGAGTSLLSPITLILVVGLGLWVVFRSSTLHTHVRLTGADERMAYTAGVKTDVVRIAAHMVGGVFMGLAGLAYTGLIASGDPTQGSTFTLQAVTALVLGGASLAGGRGGATGSALGAANMFLIVNLLATFNFGMASGSATKLTFGLILIGSLLINVLSQSRPAAR